MRNSGIHIRPAVHDDIPAVCDIERSGPGLWNESQFTSELKNSFSLFIVAESEGRITGYAVAWIVADEIQINSIAVSQGSRRRGTGTLLIRNIILNAEIGPAYRIFIEVSESNTGAIAFYRVLGFMATGTRKNYYRNSDAILMEMVVKNES